MLSPSDRLVLTEALAPPTGYRFDRLVGTTWSLDLIALLTLPLSFGLAGLETVDDRGRADALTLLDALRRHANSMIVFCEGGRIAVPRGSPLLLGWLEQVVVQAEAPKGGAFHAKVLVARYVGESADPVGEDLPLSGDGAVRYRVLCGTRNLTFDRSWDTMLVLEGELGRRVHARNRPLAEFVRGLPHCAVRELDSTRMETVETLADEILRVAFEAPGGFGVDKADLAFWPLGLDEDEPWPFYEGADRLLVVTPFVDRTCLRWLADEGPIAGLVSRPEELDALPAGSLDGVRETLVLADGLESGEGVDPSSEVTDPHEAAQVDATGTIDVGPSGATLRGLHAKFYVSESGRYAWLFTGSANATEAAFTRNLEFLVGLRGLRSQVGIDALLEAGAGPARKGKDLRFRDLLAEYSPPEEPTRKSAALERLEDLLDQTRRLFVASQIQAEVEERPVEEGDRYSVCLRACADGTRAIPEGVRCGVWLVTLPESSEVPVTSLVGEVAHFHAVAFETLTAFVAVRATAMLGEETLSTAFVLTVPLVGAPEDRESRLLLALISNRERFVRYLLMLLADPYDGRSGGDGSWRRGPWGGGGCGHREPPLLEAILQTAADDPSRLDAIDRLVRDLDTTEEGRALLSPEFVTLWGTVREAVPGRGGVEREGR